MTQSEFEFLEANKYNFTTVDVGFVRNLSEPILNQYHDIYKKYIDSSYILTAWCSNCVFKMIEKLSVWYKTATVDPEIPTLMATTNFVFPDSLDDIQADENGSVEMSEPAVEQKKRGRKKLNP